MNPSALDTDLWADPEQHSLDISPVVKRIYDPKAFLDAHAAEQKNSRRYVTLQRAVDRSPQRELTQVTHAMLDKLAGLAVDQPHCKSAIDYIRQQLALSRLAIPATLRWPPILLEGSPGVGKTYFARALARLLDNELAIINCSTVTASFVLSGNNPSWNDSRPGKIFTALNDGRFANPIVLLDEVDKMGGDRRFDGYGPLYQLLEKDTARCFVDEHVGLPVDASDIIWIATANNCDALPEPIRSRFHTLFISPPDTAQAQSVVQSVYRELLEYECGWRRVFAPKLTPRVADAMAGISPREMRGVLLSAMGKAALQRRTDTTLALRTHDLDLDPLPHTRRIGFLG